MKKFVKNYIGKGKQVEGLSIIKVNLKISDILKFAHNYNDEDYISLEIARLQTPDNFGNAYTVYVNRLEEEKIKEQAPAARKQIKKSKSQEKVEVPL
jgi:phage protein D